MRYDPLPLDARLEQVEETPDWRKETVTISAPYGDERIIVHVYLPRSAPPYHPVIFAAGGDAQLLPSSSNLRLTESDFVVRSGRALVYPVYKGTYERIVKAAGPNTGRESVDSARQGPAAGRRFHRVETRPRSSAHRLLRAQRRARFTASSARRSSRGSRRASWRAAVSSGGRRPRKSIPSTSRRASACRR